EAIARRSRPPLRRRGQEGLHIFAPTLAIPLKPTRMSCWSQVKFFHTQLTSSDIISGGEQAISRLLGPFLRSPIRSLRKIEPPLPRLFSIQEGHAHENHCGASDTVFFACDGLGR